VDDELFEMLASSVARLDLELVEAEMRPGIVRVVVDRPGGVDVDAIAEATRAVSAVLDEHDPQPGRRYTLEVSSPGVERPLRTPKQFESAVGEKVTVRTVSGGEGERRFTGRLARADETGIVLEGEELVGGELRLAYEEVQRARTVFEWPAASRSSGKSSRSSPSRNSRRRTRDAERVTTR